MAILKEDGSLDIERINSLPLEEYMEAMGDLTEEQIKEYNSKLPLNESNEPMMATEVDYSFDDAIQSGRMVNAEAFINNLKRRCKKNQ